MGTPAARIRRMASARAPSPSKDSTTGRYIGFMTPTLARRTARRKFFFWYRRPSDAGGSTMSQKVDAFVRRQDKWKDEFEKLRAIIVDCGLHEDLKWGQPCYDL